MKLFAPTTRENGVAAVFRLYEYAGQSKELV